jgi:hypothetical protein
MTDEFQFGERAKHPARLSGPRPPRPTSLFPFKLVGVVACLVAAAAAAFVFLSGADEAGTEIADARSETLAQIDRAYDAAAQGTVGRAVVVAQTLYAEQGTFTTDLPTLSAFDPGLRFTSGPSTGPETVSYAVGGTEFAAAVRSGSGACWWVKIDASSRTSYGSGATCTGRAALAASSPSW